MTQIVDGHFELTGQQILARLHDAREGGISFTNLAAVEDHVGNVHHIDLRSPEATVYRARHYHALLVGKVISHEPEVDIP